MLFYSPYAMYMMNALHTPGQALDTAGGYEGVFLGLLITVGNVIVYNIINTLSEKIAFNAKQKKDIFALVLYTFAVLVNTILDLWTTVIMARGQVEDAKYKSRSLDLAAQMAAHVPTLQESLGLQLFAYLFPSTILFPFLMEPVGAVVPYFFSVWSVRADPACTHREAEEALMCPEFDMGHYADVILNIALCVLLLGFSSSVLLPTFLCILGTLAWLYFWDKYRLLRVSCYTPFSSNHLEIVAEDLFLLPFGFLAGVVVWRAYEVKYIELDAKYVPLLCFGAFAIHAMLQLFFQHVIINWIAEALKKEVGAGTFEECAGKTACSWFNANPVHCLRSRYVHSHEPACVPYVNGKLHLLKRNVKAGAFFDGSTLGWDASKYGEHRQQVSNWKDIVCTLVEK